MWFKKSKNDQPPKVDYFNSAWLHAWKKNLKESETYREAGKKWNAPLLLKFQPVPPELTDHNSIGFYLDLRYGECSELRYATNEDENSCDYILKADRETWINLIENKKDPTLFLMQGKLNLEKGSLVVLSTHRKAASALLHTAPANPEKIHSWTKKEKNKPAEKNRSQFTSTGRGIDHDSKPMRLFQKAKTFGIWNPSAIDLERDKKQWQTLSSDEKEILLHLSSLFMAGEEAVTLDLLPLIRTLSKEGRLEEEIFLTSFLWEEAKHTEFFSIYINSVFKTEPDHQKYHAPFYKKLFYEQLPADLARLDNDTSIKAQLMAAGTYNIIVEGVLAETGYHAYYKMLSDHDLLPGLQEGITHIKQDESRHIAFGIYLINRLLESNPNNKEFFEGHLAERLDSATNIIFEIFEPYDVVPFGLTRDWFLDYALKQFQKRNRKLLL
jgi:ribonucleoside-diphosphate reductase beta chain